MAKTTTENLAMAALGGPGGSLASFRGVRRTQPELDVSVALEVGGFRWAEWNHASLRGAPLDEPGRFLASPRGLLAHLQIDARPDTPLAEDPLRYLPFYSADPREALAAAEVVGLFSTGGGVLRREDDGRWILEVSAAGIHEDGPDLPVVLCRAALAWTRSSGAVYAARPDPR